MVPNISKFADRIGINAEQIGTNKRSLDYSVFEPMTDDFYNVTKESIERVYTTFVDKVAEGRNMTFEQVDEIGQGRVWTGENAKELGLVDVLGDLSDAIKIAEEMTGLEHYRLVKLPKQKDPIEDTLKQIMN
jgi:protease-4